MAMATTLAHACHKLYKWAPSSAVRNLALECDRSLSIAFVLGLEEIVQKPAAKRAAYEHLVYYSTVFHFGSYGHSHQKKAVF